MLQASNGAAVVEIPRLKLNSVSMSPRPKCTPTPLGVVEHSADMLSVCPQSFAELVRCIKVERERRAAGGGAVTCGGTDAMVILLSLRTPTWVVANWLAETTLCYAMTFGLLFSTLVSQLCTKLNTHLLYTQGQQLDLLMELLCSAKKAGGAAAPQQKSFVVVRLYEGSGALRIEAVHPSPAVGGASGVAGTINDQHICKQIDALKFGDRNARMLRAALCLQALEYGRAAAELKVSRELLMLLVGTDFAPGQSQHTADCNAGPNITNERTQLMARCLVEEVFGNVAGPPPGVSIFASAAAAAAAPEFRSATNQVYSFLLCPTERHDPFYDTCTRRATYLLCCSSIAQLEQGGRADMAAELQDRADRLALADRTLPAPSPPADAAAYAQLKLSAADLYTNVAVYQRMEATGDAAVLIRRPGCDFVTALREHADAVHADVAAIVAEADAVVLWQGDTGDPGHQALVAAGVDSEMQRRRDCFPVRLTHRDFSSRFAAISGLPERQASDAEVAEAVFERYLLSESGSAAASIGDEYVLLSKVTYAKLLAKLKDAADAAARCTPLSPLASSPTATDTRRVDARGMALVFHEEEEWLVRVCSGGLALQTLSAAVTSRRASADHCGGGYQRSLAHSQAAVCEFATRVLLSAEALCPRPAGGRLRWAVVVILRVLTAGYWEQASALASVASAHGARLAVADTVQTMDDTRLLAMLALCDVAACLVALTAATEVRAMVGAAAAQLFADAVKKIVECVQQRRAAELRDSVCLRGGRRAFVMDDLFDRVRSSSVCSALVIGVLRDQVDTAAANSIWPALCAMSAEDLFGAIVDFSQCGNARAFGRVAEQMNIAMHLKTAAAGAAVPQNAGLLADRRWLSWCTRNTASAATAAEPDHAPYCASRLPGVIVCDSDLSVETIRVEMAKSVPSAVTAAFQK
jgi:hypothetical protein